MELKEFKLAELLKTAAISTSALFSLALDATNHWIDPSLVKKNGPPTLTNLESPATFSGWRITSEKMISKL